MVEEEGEHRNIGRTDTKRPVGPSRRYLLDYATTNSIRVEEQDKQNKARRRKANARVSIVINWRRKSGEL